MADFMLLLYDDPSAFADLAPEAIQAIIARYSAWAAGLEENGTLVHSNKLVDGEARVLSRRDGATKVTDGPFSETKEVIGGYFVVRTESWDAAVEIAQACPHVDYGTIEIRRVDDV
ncbi:MAG: YciI family protein [Acidobacteriota bacterium]